MNRHRTVFLPVILSSGLLLMTVNLVSARENGPPAELISGAYRQILAGVDNNGDGKLSSEECMSVSSDKSKMEKDCKYWDANGDGMITEDEYVAQVKNIMRRN